ncbi:MAG: PQQ-dependent sugar dehydrogenase, partial [Rhodothermales bacterium]|nr:PQQ-dependent sugar dehydrogenase [Rhodothermales bacterium]
MPIRPLRLALALLVTAGCDRPDAEPAGSVPAEPTATAAVTAAPAACDEDDGGITLPDGFCARVVAEVGPARHLAVADDGTLYVKLRRVEGGGGIVALRDTTGDHRADVEARFGDFGGTGVAVHDGYLYASSDLAVYRWPLPTDGLVPEGEPTAIVEGFPRQDQHAAKPLAFDGAGGLYVTVGADANACQEQTRTPGSPGQDPCPLLDTSGGIWRFEAGAAGQSFSADARYATGVRHAVALAWNPAEGALYAVQHGRDQLHQLWPEHYTEQENADLPAEELLRLEAGADAGWPYCYYDWQE